MNSPSPVAGDGARAHPARTILKASLAGALLGAAATGLLVAIDQRLHPTGGPIDFGSPGFALAAAGVALLAGTLLSIICLGLTVAVFGVARLSNWHKLSAALVGGVAGLAVIALLYGVAWGEPPKIQYLLVGGLVGAAVAAFWAHWSRS